MGKLEKIMKLVSIFVMPLVLVFLGFTMIQSLGMDNFHVS